MFVIAGLLFAFVFVLVVMYFLGRTGEEMNIFDRLRRWWRQRDERLEERQRINAEAADLFDELRAREQPLDWLLHERKISPSLHRLAITWWRRGYLIEVEPPALPMYEMRYSRWFALTPRGKRVLGRKYETRDQPWY